MTKRILRLNKVLKEELGKIIVTEVEFPENVFCTITRVETTSNLQEAKIYVSVVPDSAQKNTFAELQKHVFHLQQLLNKKFAMRPVPKIIFVPEGKTREAAKIDQLFQEISP
jgi:ribosome-binding factor A